MRPTIRLSDPAAKNQPYPIALPNRPAKVRLGMGEWGNIFAGYLLYLSKRIVSGSPSIVHSGTRDQRLGRRFNCLLAKLKKKPYIQGENDLPTYGFCITIFGAESSALGFVIQILPAKFGLSSGFGQDGTCVRLYTVYLSLSQM